MYHVLSKSALALALTLSTTHWPYRHKTPEQLKQLSPSELVKELFEEEKNHPKASHLLDRQRIDITDAIKATRLKSLPYVIERLGQYHPSLSGIRTEREYRGFEIFGVAPV